MSGRFRVFVAAPFWACAVCCAFLDGFFGQIGNLIAGDYMSEKKTEADG